MQLFLRNNLLGDNLNPIFSTQEFHQLNNLKLLDLSGNKIKSIEEGLLIGCDKLKVSPNPKLIQFKIESATAWHGNAYNVKPCNRNNLKSLI